LRILDGGDAFKMRLMFPTAGVWTWKTMCSDTDNSGLHDRRGSVTVADYTGENNFSDTAISRSPTTGDI